MEFDPEVRPHRRYNPLMDEWVLVSPHRTQRPWQGQQEVVAREQRPTYDPNCYLCPNNSRAGSAKNPDYQGTFVFQNDFAALLPAGLEAIENRRFDGVLQMEPVYGECRVICFSHRHDLTLPDMELGAIERVVEIWAEQITDLGSRYRWVQVFENKGAAMGCSNPHPHGQVWAGTSLPNHIDRENFCQLKYADKNGKRLLSDYIVQEIQQEIRVVEQNEHWVMVVPYWATWPFELLLVPRRPVLRLPDLTAIERSSLAEILKRSLTRYDRLFETSFPYSMGWHGAPTDENNYEHWQLHAHFYPPLLRSATVRKFMVGYEMLAEPQRDLTPEQAAQQLKKIARG